MNKLILKKDCFPRDSGPKGVQRFSSGQSQEFDNYFFESSHGWLAATLVYYCPRRCWEIGPTAVTKPRDWLNEKRCRSVKICFPARYYPVCLDLPTPRCSSCPGSQSGGRRCRRVHHCHLHAFPHHLELLALPEAVLLADGALALGQNPVVC